MKKSFSAFLAEADIETTYVIKSVENIHTIGRFDLMRCALIRHGLRDLTREHVSFSTENSDFAEFPGASAYVVKAVLGTDIDSNVICQEIAMAMNVPQAEIVVRKEGEPEPDLDFHEEDEDETDDKYKALSDNEPGKATADENHASDSEVQKMVGAKRISDLMDEFSDEQDERDEETETRDVYEAYVVTHLALNEASEQKFRKGYYLIERYLGDTDKATVFGPFKNQPDNYEFRESVDSIVVSENVKRSEDGSLIVEIQFPRYTQRPGFEPRQTPIKAFNMGERRPFEVEVMNQETGQKFHVVVKAYNDLTARNVAIEMVSTEQKIPAERLIVISPKGKDHTVQ